jgi:hypothetical protein
VRQVLRKAQAVGVVAEDECYYVLQHRGLAVEGLGGLQLQQGVQGEPCAFEKNPNQHQQSINHAVKDGCKRKLTLMW